MHDEQASYRQYPHPAKIVRLLISFSEPMHPATPVVALWIANLVVAGGILTDLWAALTLPGYAGPSPMGIAMIWGGALLVPLLLVDRVGRRRYPATIRLQAAPSIMVLVGLTMLPRAAPDPMTLHTSTVLLLGLGMASGVQPLMLVSVVGLWLALAWPYTDLARSGVAGPANIILTLGVQVLLLHYSMLALRARHEARQAQAQAEQARARAEQQARQAEHDRRQIESQLNLTIGLVEAMRTTLRRPLALLHEVLAALQRHTLPGSPAHSLLGEARDTRTELDRQLRELARGLDWQVQLQTREPNRIPIPSEHLRDLVASARPPASGGALNVQLFDRRAQALPLMADMAQMRLLFHLLLDNALRYGATEVIVQLTDIVGPDALIPHYELIVHDDGEGIHPDDLPYVGQPLFRGRNGRGRDDRPGHGLGLTIAHSIAACHGGSLRLTSVLGQGTTVLVRLPRYP